LPATERELSERDDDIIDFDFFDEPATVEQQSTQRGRIPRRRPAGGPPRAPIRPPQGFTPLLRLVGLIAFAILIVVLLVFWVQSCQGNAKKNAYKSYIADVGEIARSSATVGGDLTDALTTSGTKVAELQTTLTGLAQREQQDVDAAEALDPPGALRDEHQALIRALQFRVSGLQGLATTLRRSATAKNTAATADVLAAQSQRFVASDVIWDDLFKASAAAELKRQGISGNPPESRFLTDAELATSGAWNPILSRLRGASTGGTTTGGLHGSLLESVKALSGGQTVEQGKTLSKSGENTVVATTDLGFAVAVKDSGDSQEVGIDVTLTIQKPGKPIVKTQRIQVIDPGETKTLLFRDFDLTGLFAVKTTVKVDVAPVPGEQTTSNNSASYSVIFSLS
jgi:hypothetical protein